MSAPGRHCTVSSNSVSLVFQGVRHTESCVCWLVRRPECRANAKRVPSVLDNPRLDAVLAAADAGCFATYIMKQGGVLVPRKHHLVRTAYELNDEPSAYGDHGIRIYGIWSPIVRAKFARTR